MGKFEDIMMPITMIMVLISVVGLTMMVFVGMIPWGEEKVITGYLDDFDHQVGYGYSGTTLVIDNQSYDFYPKYQGTILTNCEVKVVYKNSIIGTRSKIIQRIECNERDGVCD